MIKVVSFESYFELERKERINLKLMSGFKRLDKLEENHVLNIFNMATITCFMEGDPESKDQKKKEDKTYQVYAMVTDDGIYSTSSNSFKDDIVDMLAEIEPGQGLKVAIKRYDSKNNEGKFFRAELVDFIE